MTAEPQAPGAPAIILYRQVDRDDLGIRSKSGDYLTVYRMTDDRTSHEDNYLRIKILTEEGRKYANVEIPYVRGLENIVNIKARTIKPDGSVTNFDGKIFDKTIIKAKGVRHSVKAFTLPDVQVGGIIEYSYTVDLNPGDAVILGESGYVYLFQSHWILNQELFTKLARFSLRPYNDPGVIKSGLRFNTQGLPPGIGPKEGGDKILRMEATNIAAFDTEDFMPPENELKSRVDFIYENTIFETDPGKFWKQVGKKWNDEMEGFLKKHKAVDDAVPQIVNASDPPETKLRKLYDRVQQLRNTSYELFKTEQEQKREKDKPADSVEELWKRGYGNRIQLTWLYLAMVRAAGFEAYGIWASDRRSYFFDPKTMERRKLDRSVVLVKAQGKELYLDPGSAFTPFGMLRWDETGTAGLRLDRDGGTWIRTPYASGPDSRILHTAALKLSTTGDLEGKLTVTYTGLEAMDRRLEARHADEVGRKKLLEDELKESVPGAIVATLSNKPEWSTSESPLVAEFDVKIAGWAGSAGRRATLPVGIFSANEKHVFEHAQRVHPIYVEYPYEKLDDITVELPAGWQVTSVPPQRGQDGHVLLYSSTVENGKTKVHVVRKFNVAFMTMEVKYYPALRDFFQMVRTGDEDQVVLQPGTATASN